MADGYYSKKIEEGDLDLTFSDDGMSTINYNETWNISEIILSYTLETGSSATDFSLTDSVSIRFVIIYRSYIIWLILSYKVYIIKIMALKRSNEILKIFF